MSNSGQNNIYIILILILYNMIFSCIGNYWNIWNAGKCPLKASLHQATMGGGQIAGESGGAGGQLRASPTQQTQQT